MKRTSIKIKKNILEVLSSKKVFTFSELERKVNTGYRSIISNCEELEKFGAVKISKGEKHKANGRPYFEAKITNQGIIFLKKIT